MAQTVILTSGVLGYEQWGFTNCVRSGELLFLSGIGSLAEDGRVIGAGDIEAQTVQTYANIRAVLDSAGSRLDRILQMTTFIVDLPRNGAAYVAARQRILTAPTYTSAVVGVAALMMPGLLVEVQCIAMVDPPSAAA